VLALRRLGKHMKGKRKKVGADIDQWRDVLKGLKIIEAGEYRLLVSLATVALKTKDAD
jgi:hypothetical protein